MTVRNERILLQFLIKMKIYNFFDFIKKVNINNICKGLDRFRSIIIIIISN